MINVEFTSGEEILRGSLHLPACLDRSVPGILILPGFADTAVGPHNFHVCIARSLTRAGYAVLRFDYGGLGESEGDFRQFTAYSGLENALSALNVLRNQQEVDATRLGVVGFSLGGAFACELTAHLPELRAIALLAPVAYPSKVFRAFFTSDHLKQAEEQGWIDWLGWSVGHAYLPSLETLKPLDVLKQSRVPTLVIHGTTDSEVPAENAWAYADAGAVLHWLEAGDHQFSSVYWQEIAIHHICTWFEQNLSIAGHKRNSYDECEKSETPDNL